MIYTPDRESLKPDEPTYPHSSNLVLS
jgi:hypothetical protein